MSVQKASVIAAVLAVWVAGTQAQQPQKPAPAGAGAPTPRPTESQSAPQSKSALSGSDRSFILKAADAGHQEIALAQVAQSKASSPNVKSLADRLLKDHQQNAQELESLAQSKGVTLPPAKDDKAHTAKFEKLEGAAFDRAYTQMMVQDHTTAINLFRQASKSKDSDVKAFADKTLPTLQEHHKLAHEAQDSLKASTSCSATAPKPPASPKPAPGDKPYTPPAPKG